MSNSVVLALVVVLQVAANVCLSRGMRQVGELHTLDPAGLLAIGLRLLTNRSVLLGVALLIAFFLAYLVALSRLDLSYVLPMTASSYVLTVLFAWWALGEAVDAMRWAGTCAVTIGVLLVGGGERAGRPGEGER